MNEEKFPIARRFRGFLPVVIDLETGGFNPETDALFEVATVIIEMDEEGTVTPGKRLFFNVHPFEGANIEQSSLDFTGIDPDNPLRDAVSEKDALSETFREIRTEIRHTGCQRAIMVAHNAAFDLSFINAVATRCNLKRNPFHPFSTLDTVSLSGLAFGQTVLARACASAGIDFNSDEAHSANYDCDKTAEVFCHIVNHWRDLTALDS
ncbi:MAG TPA: ribonuclease T [Gammaproteobacteria bacterium]|nr:ribonuclease T [Gammaproteobacteria bacterium]